MRTRSLVGPLLAATVALAVLTACGSGSDDAARSATPAAPSPTATLPPPTQSLDAEPDQAAVGEALVGLTKAQAEEAAEAAGYTVRVTMEDGQMFPMTMDYRTDRINIEVENGVVTRAFVG
jgi:major membrane immunogen (membrane-anchored lipoprotein)